jgi:hypothetical protein
MFIPDPTFFYPASRIRIFPSRIRIKEFKHFNPKKWFLSSIKYDPGCSSRIPDPDPYFYPSRIPDPGVKKAPDPGSRIGIRNTGKNLLRIFFLVEDKFKELALLVHKEEKEEADEEKNGEEEEQATGREVAEEGREEEEEDNEEKDDKDDSDEEEEVRAMILSLNICLVLG